MMFDDPWAERRNARLAAEAEAERLAAEAQAAEDQYVRDNFRGDPGDPGEPGEQGLPGETGPEGPAGPPGADAPIPVEATFERGAVGATTGQYVTGITVTLSDGTTRRYTVTRGAENRPLGIRLADA